MARTEQLTKAGQSIWLDNITRDLLDDGSIERCITDLAVTGLTSNPSIFDKAIAGSASYDAEVRRLAKEGHSVEETFFALAIDDLRRAADLFRPVFNATGGVDGYVSLEVSPTLADDTEGTIAAAVSLHEEAARPNLFIKIPGTPAGLPAIEEAIFSGVPVNVTLLFSVADYLAAADAYLRGLERRRDAGLDLAVASVASLFISRWDAAVASTLPVELHNTVGIAIGQQAYVASLELLASTRVRELEAAGAHMQRLLFASTGTKDPAAPDTLYVGALCAPGTVNTMPDATLEAWADHGELSAPLAADPAPGAAALAQAAAAGVDVDALALRLQEEGKDAFVRSWESLLASIASKAAP